MATKVNTITPWHQNPSSSKIFVELHSEEVNEIMSRPPNWLVGWGLSIFFSIMVVLIAACCLIKYPDVLAVPFTLTAMDAPRVIVVKTDGKLTRLLVKDNQIVSKGQLLTYSESTGDHGQIIRLGEDLDKFANAVKANRWSSVNDLNIASYNRLGEIQNDYQVFTQKLDELKASCPLWFKIVPRKQENRRRSWNWTTPFLSAKDYFNKSCRHCRPTSRCGNKDMFSLHPSRESFRLQLPGKINNI
jgi:hypothetical protein